MAQYFLGNVIGAIGGTNITNATAPASSFISGEFFYNNPLIPNQNPTGRIFNTSLSFDNALEKSQTSRILTFQAPVKGIYLINLFIVFNSFKPFLAEFQLVVTCSKQFTGRVIYPQRYGGQDTFKAMNLVELEANETVTFFYPFFPSVTGARTGFIFVQGSNIFISLIKETT